MHDGWNDRRMDGMIDGWMHGWNDECMDWWMDGRIVEETKN